MNTSLFDKDKFKKVVSAVKDAFRAGIYVSNLVAVASEGGKLGSVSVPAGKIGLATICSVAINGMLLKAGFLLSSDLMVFSKLEIRSLGTTYL